mmetsp:Transcript_21578/g.54481  ORF Transcript_21578/g.54481 Transcript_21578/m.54481 type:complete len:273 (-) Transcript_21578:428-1246(-)
MKVVVLHACPEGDDVTPGKDGCVVPHVHVGGRAHAPPHPEEDVEEVIDVQVQRHKETGAENHRFDRVCQFCLEAERVRVGVVQLVDRLVPVHARVEEVVPPVVENVLDRHAAEQFWEDLLQRKNLFVGHRNLEVGDVEVQAKSERGLNENYVREQRDAYVNPVLPRRRGLVLLYLRFLQRGHQGAQEARQREHPDRGVVDDGGPVHVQIEWRDHGPKPLVENPELLCGIRSPEQRLLTRDQGRHGNEDRGFRRLPPRLSLLAEFVLLLRGNG